MRKTYSHNGVMIHFTQVSVTKFSFLATAVAFPYCLIGAGVNESMQM